LPLVKHCCSNY